MRTEAEEGYSECDAETGIETVQPSLAVRFKRLLQEEDGENMVREIIDGVLTRRGMSGALPGPGEQMVLRNAMDELEEDPSDKAAKVLNIIFGCFDAYLLKVEQQFPLKKSIKPADETPQGVADITFASYD